MSSSSKIASLSRAGFLRTGLALAALWSVAGAASLNLAGCTSDPEPLDLTSLRRSAEASFLCVDFEGNGVPLELCPQGERTNDYGLTVGVYGYELVSLVTQTLSAEVAVIRVSGIDQNGDSSGRVLDADTSNPGVTPLRVGGHPTGIATTPGGKASFVGVSDAGLEGIFGLPTSCIFRPEKGESARDVTTWPACSLSSAPGDILMLVDPVEESGEERRWCNAGPPDNIPRPELGWQCAVDLSEESATKGRRKLLVALPAEGKLVLIDAQDVLDREAGTFAPCHIEAELALEAEVPNSLVQALPPDLRDASTGAFYEYTELGGSYKARPAGMDERDGLVVVADRASPVIQRIDARDPCVLQALSPLYATSLLQPTRVVTTSRLAISPMTLRGKQFLYVVDESGNELSSIAIFDLSATASSNTPIVRPDSPYLPLESPDRIEFAASVKDVAFAFMDRPKAAPATGIAATGTFCDPDPAATGEGIAPEYRPTGDGEGADPQLIRGIFGYALLGTGTVAIIDVEDLDAACRRPVRANKSSQPDFRGCFSDTISADYYTRDGGEASVPTVTDEASCRAVVPHRLRSQVRIENVENSLVNAPALRAFGRLSQRGRGLPISRLTAEGRRNPILLGVDFESPEGNAPEPAQVYVGNNLWIRGTSTDPLIVDPNKAEKASLVLPFFAPRAYPYEEVVSVIYEGVLDRTHDTGLLSSPTGKEEKAQASFEDINSSFCTQGVLDRRLTAEIGTKRFGLSSGALSRFVDRHTDYLQITNLLLNEEDPYWATGGRACGQDSQFVDDIGYVLCDSLFRQGDADELAESRDLTIDSAFDDRLELVPRVKRGRTAEEHLALVSCCFPQTLSYRLRAGHQWVVKGEVSGFQHAVITDPESDEGECILDASPIKSALRGRAFEVSSTTCIDGDSSEIGTCGVGFRSPEDVVCSYDASTGALTLGGVASECIFDGITRRFAVYRGIDPSERDMAFGFEVMGGFRGDAIPLAFASDGPVLPVSIVPIPTFGALGVVDSQNRGLMMIDVANSQVAASYY